MNLLPLEIVHRILEYRNGKYVNQIAPEDSRYEILKTLPKIEYDGWTWDMIINTIYF